jgi:ribosomal protein L32
MELVRDVQAAKKKRTKKVMKLIDSYTGLMECRVCGYRHLANRVQGGFYARGSWQCTNGCRLD